MVVRFARMASSRFWLQRKTEGTGLQSIGRLKIQAIRKRGKRPVKMRGSGRVQRGIQDKDSNYDIKIEIDWHSAKRISADFKQLQKQEYWRADRYFEEGPKRADGATEESKASTKRISRTVDWTVEATEQAEQNMINDLKWLNDECILMKLKMDKIGRGIKEWKKMNWI